MSEVSLYTDGACTQHGEAGAAALLLKGEKRLKLAAYLGASSSSEAERIALLLGLALVSHCPNVSSVTWQSDHNASVVKIDKSRDPLIERITAQYALRPEFVARRVMSSGLRSCDRASRWMSRDGEKFVQKKAHKSRIGRMALRSPEEAWLFLDGRTFNYSYETYCEIVGLLAE